MVRLVNGMMGRARKLDKIDEWGPQRPLEAAKDLLDVIGHTYFEVFSGHTVTKIYLDRDEYLPDGVLIEAVAGEKLAEVRSKVGDLIDHISKKYGVAKSSMDFKVATRHGTNAEGRQKLSFRPYISGVKIRYSQIPALIESAGMKSYWDTQPYGKTQQLLAAINGTKGSTKTKTGQQVRDGRVLRTENPDEEEDLEDYIAQVVEDGWPLIDVQIAKMARTNTLKTPATQSAANVDAVDEQFVSDVLDCLSLDRVIDRNSWRSVGFALKLAAKNSRDSQDSQDSENPRFLKLFKEFSWRAVQYRTEADQKSCEDLWWSCSNDDQDGNRDLVTMGTLCAWAKVDDREKYAAAVHASKKRVQLLKRVEPQIKSPSDVMETARKLHEILELPSSIVDIKESTLSGNVLQLRAALGDGSESRLSIDCETLYMAVEVLGVDGVPVTDFARFLNHNQATALRVAGVELSRLHKDLHPETEWLLARPTETKTVFSTNLASKNARNATIEVYNLDDPSRASARLEYHDVRKTVAVKKGDLSVLQNAYQGAILETLKGPLSMGWVNVNFNFNSTVAADDTRPFEVLQSRMCKNAREGRLRKRDGCVWHPVPGAPCSYTRGETYGEYLNRIFEKDKIFHANVKVRRDLIEYLTEYNPTDIKNFVPDRDLLSFRNGVLSLSTGRLFPHDDASLAGRIARRHLDLDWTGSTETPLLDQVLSFQFSPEVAEVLCALLGRCLFQVNQLDGWQVMPYLVGVGGTGKSMLLKIVKELFEEGAVGNLKGTREAVFGLANLADKEVVMGTDMPQKLSACLSQEDMQAMVSGDGMEIPRKGQLALNMTWRAPVILASNHMPDYINTGNNVGRRIVAFCFERVVSQPDETLFQRVLEGEMPNVVARLLASYEKVRQTVRERGGGFWRAVPEQLLQWQSKIAGVTNKLHAFLAMDDEERVTHEDRLAMQRYSYAILKEEGAVTWLEDLKKAYRDVMNQELSQQPDAAVLHAFGFYIDPTKPRGENVCRACKQKAASRGGKCCDNYSHGNRAKKILIHNMRLTLKIVA
jgi:phage/plasmid-associated DNA primase